MTTPRNVGRYKAGLAPVQIWIDKPIWIAAKLKATQEGKSMREVMTDFLAWYGGLLDEPTQESIEDGEAGTD